MIIKQKIILFNLDCNYIFCNLCPNKVQTRIEMLSRKAEGLDPLKP
jgi:hypothetical protein